MFSQLSTDNLLDNLESELTELVELDSPKAQKQLSPQIKKSSPEKIFQPPVPAKRNFLESSEKFPVPAVRKNHSLDKREKNDENEIIQMSSLHSDHASVSSDIEHISRGSSTQSRQNSVIVVDEKKKKKKKTSDVRIVHESEKISHEETFIVVKHGKWADEARNEQEIEEIKERVEAVNEKIFKPALDVIDENPKKKKNKKKTEIIEERRTSVSSVVSEDQKTNTESSSLEESPQPKKKIKKPEKKSKNHRKKITSEEVSATTQASSKRSALKKDARSNDKAIGMKKFLKIYFWVGGHS